jgi:hypothetical protein
MAFNRLPLLDYSSSNLYQLPDGGFVDAQVDGAGSGRRKQQEQLFCEVTFGNPVVGHGAIPKVTRVGGAFAIEVLALALAPDRRFTQQRGGGGGILPPLREEAVLALRRLLPEAPAAPVKESDSGAAFLLAWIQANHDRLAKRTPITVLAAPSEARCRAVLRRDPANVPNDPPKGSSRL